MLLLNKYLKVSKLLVCLLLFKSSIGQNLIRNGSFESYNTPINWNWWGGDFIGYYVSPPDTVMIDWMQYNTPDFFISACPHTFSGVPVNIFGNNYADEGNNYIGCILFQKAGDTKEYIHQRLSVPLQAGKIYCLSFFITRADHITHAIHSIGAYFSNIAPNMTSSAYLSVMPQIENQNGFISDTTDWTEIQGCFTAVGGEQFITIGNFNSNSNTDTLYVGTNSQVSGADGYAYYYIDNVTLIDQTTVGINEFKEGDRFEVYPNPTDGTLNLNLTRKGTYNNYRVKITNVVGMEILNEMYKEQIDVHSLEKGIYFLNLYKNNSLIEVKKIVKD